MKSIQINPEFGVDNLQLVQSDIPQPGPGQVLVKVHASSLNYRDLMMVRGRYNPNQPLPLVPLSDGAGEVTAVGDQVKRVKVGDRVMSLFAQTWLNGEATPDLFKATLGGPLPGMLSEYQLLSEQGVVPIPDHLDYRSAATLPCAAVTAWHAVVEKGQLSSADTVLLLGTGGVSLFALQFAKLAGARVIITSSSDEKLERARQLGADETINYREHPEWSNQVLALTDGAGVDVVIEVGGAGTMNESLKSVRMAGKVMVIGVLGGGINELTVRPILINSLNLQGIFVGSRQIHETMSAAIGRHQLQPTISDSFPLADAQAAFNHLAAGSHFGKIVIEH